jgi:predicted phage terminase large subunit-like protein
MGNSPDIKRIRAIVKAERVKMRDKAANGCFFSFIHYVNPRYRANWHHRLLAHTLEDFYRDPNRKRLMVFMPPQHGKSEQASRLFPAYVLGMNPNCKIAACSYAADLARAFNRDVQRIMDATPNYCEIFPDTRLNSARVAADSRGGTLRNTNEFEIMGNLGSYKSVGVGGGLSGRAVDLMIIDDPVKDAKEAHSETVRESVWAWYQSVAETRLHNKSKVVIIMTRWHEDDLSGRLLQTEPEKWHVISLPAIREEEGDAQDPRKPGEALWPQRHSLERLLDKQKQSPWVFAALYQQRPAPIGGGLVKTDWFPRFPLAALPRGPVRFFVDTAYTSKQENDETAILAYVVHQGDIYIIHSAGVRKEFPELCEWLPTYVEAAGYTGHSQIWVEPKASGLSVVQQLQRTTNLNIVAAQAPDSDKVTRINAVSPIIQAGRVKVLDTNAGWVNAFFGQCEAFPNGAHDDRVDTLEGAIRCDLVNAEAGIIRKRS